MLKHLINQKWKLIQVKPGEVEAYRELHFWLEGLLGFSPGSFPSVFSHLGQLWPQLNAPQCTLMRFLFFFFDFIWGHWALKCPCVRFLQQASFGWYVHLLKHISNLPIEEKIMTENWENSNQMNKSIRIKAFNIHILTCLSTPSFPSLTWQLLENNYMVSWH